MATCGREFDDDFTKRHMEKYHLSLVNAGKTPATIPVVEASQSNIKQFFSPTARTAAQPSSTSDTNLNNQPSTSTFASQPSFPATVTDEDEQLCDESHHQSSSFQPSEIGETEKRSSPASIAMEESSSSSNDDPSVSQLEEEEDQEEEEENIGDLDFDEVPIIAFGPKQPILESYPVTKTKGRNRSFRTEWYSTFPWLEYDQEKNEASCFTCKNFLRESNFQFSTWGDLRRLKKHQKSKSHEQSMVAWIASKSKRKNEVLTQLKTKKAEEIEQNRAYLKTIVESLTFVAKQNIAIRSKNDDRTDVGNSSDTNRGNFLELLNLRCRDIPWLQTKMDLFLKKHHQWTSPEIQNEILSIVAKFVLDHIISEVQAAGPYSVIADETSDISNMEQVSLYLRYVKDGEIHESFIGFVEAESTTGLSLFKLIKDILMGHSLNLNDLVGQGYDGASNMSSERVGVAGLMLQEAPRAIYIHCYGHQVNISTQKSMTSVKAFRNCLGTVQEIYNFIEASPKRHTVFKRIQEDRNENELHLKSQSKTRWANRKEATKNLLKRLSAVLQTLFTIDERDPKLTSKCNGLIASILSFEFIFSLEIVNDVLHLIDGLSTHLQSVNMDVSSAQILAEGTIEALRRDICENNFSGVWDRATAKSNELKQILGNLDPELLSQHPSISFKEPVLPRNSTYTDVKSYYREELHNKGIQQSVIELEARFNKPHQNIICALTKVVMEPNKTNIDAEIDIVSDFYGIDKPSLISGRKIVATTIELQKKEEVLSATYKLVKWLHEEGIGTILPSYQAAVAILGAIPATSCSAERSFSALRRIKTYLRNSMKEERLSNVAILNIERKTTNFIEMNHMDDIIDKFARQHETRANLLLYDV